MSTEESVRTLLFLVDTSCSMMGTPHEMMDNLKNKENGGIGAVNTAIDSVIMAIKNRPLLFAEYGFSDIAHEIPNPEKIASYHRTDLTANNSDANISKAFQRLYEKLSVDGRVDTYDGTPNLAIILIVNHVIDSVCNLQLDALFQCEQFRQAVRRVVVLGGEASVSNSTRCALQRFIRGGVYDLDGEPATEKSGNKTAEVVYSARIDEPRFFQKTLYDVALNTVEILLT
jgi:hypothetical protein